jgi:hypothetical protein
MPMKAAMNMTVIRCPMHYPNMNGSREKSLKTCLLTGDAKGFPKRDNIATEKAESKMTCQVSGLTVGNLYYD